MCARSKHSTIVLDMYILSLGFRVVNPTPLYSLSLLSLSTPLYFRDMCILSVTPVCIYKHTYAY